MFDQVPEFIKYGVTLIGGAVAWVGGKWVWALNRKDAQDVQAIEILKSELDTERQEKKALLERIRSLEQQVAKLSSELHEFRAIFSIGLNADPKTITAAQLRGLVAAHGTRYDHLRSIVHKLPIILFIKEEFGVLTDDAMAPPFMLAITDLYAATYLGQPARIYEGRRDADIWGEELATAFVQNDFEARKKPNEWIAVNEMANSPLTGIRGNWIGVKRYEAINGKGYWFGIGIHLNPDGTIIGLEFLGDELKSIIEAAMKETKS